MDITFLLWCIPFFGISLFHLYACFVGSNKKANISKALLMPMLLFAAWGFTAVSKNQSVLQQNTVLLSLAIIFGGMGDVYLLNQHKVQSFIRGLVSFFLGHVFYLIIVFSTVTLPPLPIPFLIIAVVFYLLVIFFSWFCNKRQKGGMGIAVIAYASVLATIHAVTLFLFAGYLFQGSFSSVPPNILMLFIGSTFFLISDSLLAHTIFVKPFPMHRFIVMLTYLAAQFFIVFGILMI